jgi:predicted CoA-binding protein
VSKKPKRQKPTKNVAPVVVTVSDEMLKNIHRVAERLTAKGMKVERVMPVLGVISGSSALSKMSSLKAVDGVTSVEEEVTAVLPPPDSPVQ